MKFFAEAGRYVVCRCPQGKSYTHDVAAEGETERQGVDWFV